MFIFDSVVIMRRVCGQLVTNEGAQGILVVAVHDVAYVMNTIFVMIYTFCCITTYILNFLK